MSVSDPLAEQHGDRILVRGHDLAELIPRLSFTEMLLLDLTGAVPPRAHVRLVDAVLVTIMEHGPTPSSLAARLVLDGAPESLQGAVAAGLLAVGSRFLGVIDEAASLLQRVVAGGGVEEEGLARAADREVGDLVRQGARVPGLGHNLHQREDPRVSVLLALAREQDVAGRHVQALEAVHRAARRHGKDLIVNAAGAVGAILSDLGYPPDQVRGFALVARCAGLFAHVVDERRHPQARSLWEQASRQSAGADRPQEDSRGHATR